jgi:hypothetical protein
MNRISKVAVLTSVCVLTAYITLTWFFFGSPHPCAIATRVLEAEAAGWSDEWWLDYARAMAVINVKYLNLEQSQKDKLVEEMWTAPPEVVQNYVDRDFDPQKITREMLDATRNDTPASCVEMLYLRLKKRFTGPDK